MAGSPNGALALARIVLSARNPDIVAEAFDRMFGADAVARVTRAGGPHLLQAGKVAVEIWATR
jgi:hypothetical protein